MIDVIWIKAFVKAVILPPTAPLLIALAGLLLSWRRPAFGRALALGGVVLTLVLSLPMVAVALASVIASDAPLDANAARSAQAIVILGSGTRGYAAEYGGDAMSSRTLERVRYGARVARRTGLPILVSGGATYGGTPEATLMSQALEDEFDVHVHWAEGDSRTTHENARNSAVMLRAGGVSRVVLVAHGVDMQRAKLEFAAAGLDVVAAPTVLPAREFGPLDYVPSMSGLLGSYYAIYEMIALVVFRWFPAT